jgi:pyridoxal 5'-phosphate synthase pdxS subunit
MDFAGFVVKLQAGDSSAIAAALVTAVAAVLVGAFLTDYFKLTSFVDASRGLGEAMVGINVSDLPAPHRLSERGW